MCSSQALPPFQNFPNVKFFHSPNQPSLTYSVKTEVNHISLSIVYYYWPGVVGLDQRDKGKASSLLFSFNFPFLWRSSTFILSVRSLYAKKMKGFIHLGRSLLSLYQSYEVKVSSFASIVHMRFFSLFHI